MIRDPGEDVGEPGLGSMSLSLAVSISVYMIAAARRRDPTRRHDAGCLGREIEVSYPFHPLSGQTAIVVADQIHDGCRHLNLRSEDGASFLVPAWMTQAEAASVKIVDAPCLSLARLLELRAFVDSVLASQRGKRSPVRRRRWRCVGYSRNRICSRPRRRGWCSPPAERTKLVDQLRVLLMEAMATPHAGDGAQDQWEAGDDEDHA